jgi:hypothetical protein
MTGPVPRGTLVGVETPALRAEVGDRLIISAHRVRGLAHEAEILAVLGEDGGPPFVVRWFESRRVSCVCPGPDAAVQPTEPLP